MQNDRDAATMRVIEELKRVYKSKILPLETQYRYDQFYSPYMTDPEFDSKPQVMLLGQYSVGKTTFIRYLIGRDFPGQRIGPEPTTDRFTAVMDGPEDRIIPGNALCVSPELPYRGLERFGVAFLNRFEGAVVSSAVLRHITLVDTPGVLSGEKQRTNRGYDFCKVCAWFASRADLILLLFDAHKLDISDEFKNAIESLKGNEDKIRCVLNKADQVDRQKLMRIYGALMWSMGKVMKTPEVLRVYVGTFWNEPLVHSENADLFKMESEDLMRDLRDLPRNSAVRKINELVKRIRTAKVHAYIIGHLKEQMPMMMGHAKKQAQLIADLPSVFRSLVKKHNLAYGDFPDMVEYQEKLKEAEFTKFHSYKQKLVDDAEYVLVNDIPRLMEALPRSLDPNNQITAAENAQSPLSFSGYVPSNTGAGYSAAAESNPWGDDDIATTSNPVSNWGLQDYVPGFQSAFDNVQVNGFVSGAAAKGTLSATGAPTSALRKIWELSDVDKDGQLNLREFVIAMYLAELAKSGQSVPSKLDPTWIP